MKWSIAYLGSVYCDSIGIPMQKKVPAPPGTVVKRSSAGLGLFAARPYKKGERVIEYVGRTLSEKEATTSNSLYLFQISKGRTIDGKPAVNPAGYINHSCRPNCEVYIYGGRVFIRTSRKIKLGTEFSYDYGEEYFIEHIKPYGCQCPATKHLYDKEVKKRRR